MTNAVFILLSVNKWFIASCLNYVLNKWLAYNFHCFCNYYLYALTLARFSPWCLNYCTRLFRAFEIMFVSPVQGHIFVSNGWEAEEEEEEKAEYLLWTVITCLMPAEKHSCHSAGKQIFSGLLQVGREKHQGTPWFACWYRCWCCFPFTSRPSK